ncbi:MAG: hypothetical protein QM704_27115 [Anaeromyxobacteraceae bacterium]
MNARVVLAALAAFSLAACSGSGSGAQAPPAPVDTDGDGLSDADEAPWGTSPVLADTDGDGYSDLEEIVQYGFDPTHNNYEFNPLVSDLPRLGVYFETMPAVKLHFSTAAGQSREVSTSHERGIASTQTTSSSTSNSTAVEVSQTVGAEVTAGVEVGSSGVSGSASVSASYEASFSTTNEQTVSFTSEQSQESSDTWGEANTFAQDSSISYDGGAVLLAARIVNEGSIAFELRSITLGMTAFSPAGERILTPVGNLQFDGGAFPTTTLGPGQSSAALVFSKNDLDLGTAQALLADASGLSVQVSTYELTDGAGRGFNHRLTEVHARTAQVVIDYGGRDGRGVERYNVATNADPATLAITAKRALEILRVPFQVDAAGHLTGVRTLAADAVRRRSWHAVHVVDDGVAQHVAVHGPQDAYDFQGLELRSGDVLHLVLMEDEDGDGIGMRQEFIYGTRDDALDDDADGLSDADEKLRYGTNPLRPDSDGDGKRDGAEVFQAVHGGVFATIAVAIDGSVWGFGINGNTNLGPTSPTHSFACLGNTTLNCERKPVRIVFPGPARKVVSAAVSRLTAAAVLDDGTVWTWGGNLYGALGAGQDFGPDRAVPAALPESPTRRRWTPATTTSSCSRRRGRSTCGARTSGGSAPRPPTPPSTSTRRGRSARPASGARSPPATTSPRGSRRTARSGSGARTSTATGSARSPPASPPRPRRPPASGPPPTGRPSP